MNTFTIAGLALMWLGLAAAIAVLWRRLLLLRTTAVATEPAPAVPAETARRRAHVSAEALHVAQPNYRQLYELAAERGIAGRLSMSKAQLIEALAEN